MIFGLTTAERAARKERRSLTPTRVFAWLPIQLSDGRWVWWQEVIRTGPFFSLYCFTLPDKTTRSQKLRDAGYTPRDSRLECDECGTKCSVQMLPVHKCEGSKA